jgi:hypothetical protein
MTNCVFFFLRACWSTSHWQSSPDLNLIKQVKQEPKVRAEAGLVSPSLRSRAGQNSSHEPSHSWGNRLPPQAQVPRSGAHSLEIIGCSGPRHQIPGLRTSDANSTHPCARLEQGAGEHQPRRPLDPTLSRGRPKVEATCLDRITSARYWRCSNGSHLLARTCG